MDRYPENIFYLNGVEVYAGGIDLSTLRRRIQPAKKRKRKIRQEQKKARRKNRA